MKQETTVKAGERTQHTPGPWEIEVPTDYWQTKDIVGQCGEIAGQIVFNSGSDLEKSQANARLIAAAPELLSVLKHVIAKAYKNDKMYDYEVHPEVIEQVNIAIARAEGKEEVR